MISKKTIILLSLLSATAPLATDMYLSSMPLMRNEFATDTTKIQLTLTTFLIGLSLGQLLIGPLSDQYGRKKPIIIGMFFCLLSSIACSFVTNIDLLIWCRFFQGFSGAAGVVLARAIITDLVEDRKGVARLYQIMMSISTLAPILAPTIGTFISIEFGWRSIFVFFSIVSLISALGTYFFIPESLPISKRKDGGVRIIFRSIYEVISNKNYLSYSLSMSTLMLGLFAYISGSPFVLQNVLGLSPSAYALVFGGNAVGIALVGLVSAKLVKKHDPKLIATIGLGLFIIMSCLLFITFYLNLSTLIIISTLFITLSLLGLVFSNCSSLAISEVRHLAGTGSAVLGALQFTMGAIASPVVGLFGRDSGIPLAATMVFAGIMALIILSFSHKES